MKILVTGITGFIGQKLGAKLCEEGHSLVALSRSAKAELPFPADLRTWDEPGNVSDVEAIIHLAGESIAAGRWTETQKAKILKSRTETAKKLGQLAQGMKNLRVAISASGVGYYGDRGDEILNEKSAVGSGFLADVCVAWEKSALAIGAPRTVMLRTGLVLGREGGALPTMLLPFKMGVGGRVGSGEQWMSWIHIDDLVEMYLYVLREEKARGAINAVAPNPVTNAEFTKALGKALGRPTILPVPAFGLKLALGEMSQLLLISQRVKEEVSGRGFRFRFTKVDAALSEIVK